MKATEQYFPVMLFIMLYKVVLTFESVDEIVKRNVMLIEPFAKEYQRSFLDIENGSY